MVRYALSRSVRRTPGRPLGGIRPGVLPTGGGVLQDGVWILAASLLEAWRTHVPLLRTENRLFTDSRLSFNRRAILGIAVGGILVAVPLASTEAASAAPRTSSHSPTRSQTTQHQTRPARLSDEEAARVLASLATGGQQDGPEIVQANPPLVQPIPRNEARAVNESRQRLRQALTTGDYSQLTIPELQQVVTAVTQMVNQAGSGAQNPSNS